MILPECDNFGDDLDWNAVQQSWLDVSTVQRVLQCSKQNIHMLIKKRRLRAVKVGSKQRGNWLIEPGSLQSWIDSR